ncbi:acetyl-CoA hydrolase/transferase family protein [Sphingobium subterraneum]|uniref:Acetyl-CoA hydrolase n=1 Tax=Sphingobium subterraneum TaxID=627688 RepID=A0A841J2Y5_9SPHN|nr:acetyl-CoA hydrolase/transferase C-terminal domain-containing protein [Sphingobium subterraneum]MBB6122975.1 acetyl-CoA hydrolase [Sphingobium subterraneum]
MRGGRAGRELTLGSLRWTELVPRGAMVVWGQASAEPASLTASLMAQRAAIGQFRAFVGMSWGSSVSPDFTDQVAYTSYCGAGANRRLGAALDILPLPYTQLASTLAEERPVLLLGLGLGSSADSFSFGAAREYLAELIDGASLVIAEVSEGFPRSAGSDGEIPRDCIDIIVRTQGVPISLPPGPQGDTDGKIAARIAALIEDGSTLQIGLGGIPAAVLNALKGHRNLGVHSGLIGDEIAELAAMGVITNALKTIDRNLTVTGLLAGGPTLMKWADGNAGLALRPTRYTHDASILASIDKFVAINSAIEVDLTGQVNAEVAGGHYVGAVGGAGAFLRGAHESRGGLPIIALPSTAKGRSRIVANLSGPVSTARADAGIVVTEHGVADLRGLSLRRRREAMLAIAEPACVAALEQESGRSAQYRGSGQI